MFHSTSTLLRLHIKEQVTPGGQLSHIWPLVSGRASLQNVTWQRKYVGYAVFSGMYSIPVPPSGKEGRSLFTSKKYEKSQANQPCCRCCGKQLKSLFFCFEKEIKRNVAYEFNEHAIISSFQYWNIERHIRPNGLCRDKENKYNEYGLHRYILDLTAFVKLKILHMVSERDRRYKAKFYKWKLLWSDSFRAILKDWVHLI